MEGKNFAHGKTNVKFKKVSSYERQLRNSKFPHPAATTKEKRQSHVLICFLAKTLVFGSQDFPANNSVPDSPRTQTDQKAPSYSSTA